MSQARTRAVDVEIGKRSAYFTGTGVAAVLDALGIPRMRCPYTRRICCPIDRADDAIAYIEYQQRRLVTVTAGDR